jgi:hypothetical protein
MIVAEGECEGRVSEERMRRREKLTMVMAREKIK